MNVGINNLPPGQAYAARIPLPDAAFPLTVRHLKPLMVDYGYLHRHPEFEICFFPADTGTFLIQDREYAIRAGDIFIVNANDIHQPILDNSRNEGAIATYFSPRVLGEGAECGDWLNPFLFAAQMGANRVRSNPRLRTLIVELHGNVEQQARHWQLASRGLLAHILSIIACEFLDEHDTSGIAPNLKAAHRFGRVIAYINDHLHEPIAVTDLYKLAHLSRSQFSAAFRSSFGTNVASYIQAQRVSRAKRMLRSTSMTITQIAQCTGFNSSSFFSTVFKKHARMTPIEYRKRMPD